MPALMDALVTSDRVVAMSSSTESTKNPKLLPMDVSSVFECVWIGEQIPWGTLYCS